MNLQRKKATAEITTALLCRSNIGKDTFGTVAEYLEDEEIENVIVSCIDVLAKRNKSGKTIAQVICAETNFDDIAKNIDSKKLQEILSMCGRVIVRRKKEVK